MYINVYIGGTLSVQTAVKATITQMLSSFTKKLQEVNNSGELGVCCPYHCHRIGLGGSKFQICCFTVFFPILLAVMQLHALMLLLWHFVPACFTNNRCLCLLLSIIISLLQTFYFFILNWPNTAKHCCCIWFLWCVYL